MSSAESARLGFIALQREAGFAANESFLPHCHLAITRLLGGKRTEILAEEMKGSAQHQRG